VTLLYFRRSDAGHHATCSCDPKVRARGGSVHHELDHQSCAIGSIRAELSQRICNASCDGETLPHSRAAASAASGNNDGDAQSPSSCGLSAACIYRLACCTGGSLRGCRVYLHASQSARVGSSWPVPPCVPCLDRTCTCCTSSIAIAMHVQCAHEPSATLCLVTLGLGRSPAAAYRRQCRSDPYIGTDADWLLRRRRRCRSLRSRGRCRPALARSSDWPRRSLRLV
jgi:hypothetical protein